MKRGFTLIELLVVIAIVGLLASLILSSIQTGLMKGRDTRRKSDLAELQKALEEEYLLNNVYPNGTCFSIWNNPGPWEDPASPDCATNPLDITKKGFYPTIVATGLLTQLPLDPVNTQTPPGNYLGDGPPADLGYVYTSDGQHYILGTNLESGGGTNSDCGNYQLKNLFGQTGSYACAI